MSAPLARGILIAASVVVAAGIAIMENEQVRRWLDEHRRRIAIVLHNLGNEIHPPSHFESEQAQAEMEQLNRQRRHDIVRANREELIRRARENGESVDLDELTALGMLEREAEEDLKRAQSPPAERTNLAASFGDFVGADGKLRSEPEMSTAGDAALATALSQAESSGLRQRGARGFATGAGSAFSMNPFGDDMALDEDATELICDDIASGAPSESEPPLNMISPRPESATPSVRNILIAQPIYSPGNVDVTAVQANYPSQTRHALQDYQLQLMLLEQQNKRRLQEARRSTEQAHGELKTEDEFQAEIDEAIRQSLEVNIPQLIDVGSPETAHAARSQSSTPHSLADSLFEPSSPRSGYASAIETLPLARDMSQTASPMPQTIGSPLGSFYSIADEIRTIDAHLQDGERTPIGSGTLTPTDDAFSTISSIADAHEHEPELINLNDDRSETGTADSFSVVGTSTPGTWSEVGSDDGDASEAGDFRTQPPVQR